MTDTGSVLAKEIRDAIDARALPLLFEANETSRKETKELIQKIEYGWYPKDEMKVSAETIEEKEVFGGKGMFKKLMLKLSGVKGEYSFPVQACIPQNKTEKCAAFIHIAFSEMKEDSEIPLEVMCDRGFAIFTYSYGSITGDDDVFDGGLIPYLQDEDAVKNRKVGKMVLWAYGSSRVLDYVLSLNEIDPNRTAVVGHSRLGKTAVVAGVMDERYSVVISNNSGCGGAAINRGKIGERIFNITDKFSRWFTNEFTNWQGREEELPFDQHTVMALVAPRYMYVCSATDDSWADPMSEFLGAAAAGDAYAPYGKTGLVADHFPQGGEAFHEGNVGYHLRKGGHSLATEDWMRFIEFMTAHK